MKKLMFVVFLFVSRNGHLQCNLWRLQHEQLFRWRVVKCHSEHFTVIPWPCKEAEIRREVKIVSSPNNNCEVKNFASLIEQTAQAILDARAKYPEVTLAELYGIHMYLFPELVKAIRLSLLRPAVYSHVSFSWTCKSPQRKWQGGHAGLRIQPENDRIRNCCRAFQDVWEADEIESAGEQT